MKEILIKAGREGELYKKEENYISRNIFWYTSIRVGFLKTRRVKIVYTDNNLVMHIQIGVFSYCLKQRYQKQQ